MYVVVFAHLGGALHVSIWSRALFDRRRPNSSAWSPTSCWVAGPGRVSVQSPRLLAFALVALVVTGFGAVAVATSATSVSGRARRLGCRQPGGVRRHTVPRARHSRRAGRDGPALGASGGDGGDQRCALLRCRQAATHPPLSCCARSAVAAAVVIARITLRQPAEITALLPASVANVTPDVRMFPAPPALERSVIIRPDRTRPTLTGSSGSSIACRRKPSTAASSRRWPSPADRCSTTWPPSTTGTATPWSPSSTTRSSAWPATTACKGYSERRRDRRRRGRRVAASSRRHRCC